MGTDSARAPFVGIARPAGFEAVLRLGPGPLTMALSNPSRRLRVAGVGVAGEGGGDVTWLSSPPEVPPPGPWFGGWAFDAARPWAGFDAERWVLPEVLAWWEGARAWWAAFGPPGTSVTALERRLDAVREVQPPPSPVARRLAAPEAAWSERVRAALSAVREGRFEKVVLAREIELEASAPLSERAVLEALTDQHPQCWTFLLRGRDGRVFLGASPETLCEIAGGEVSADALAGTAARGEGDALLRSDKDRREHQLVVDGIRESLGPYVTALEGARAPVVKPLANVEHLFTPLRGALLPGVRPLEVARALHPTPAVAGRPRAGALAWLRAHEGFSRGWYAGAVGCQGTSGVTLAVALRSVLVDGTRARVFVGAGLVEGSTAEGEWVETERKARAVLPALGVRDD